MEITEVIEKVKTILDEVIGDSAISKNFNETTNIITEAGLDSVQVINFVLILEDEFEIEINFDQLNIDIFSSIRSLSSFIIDTINKSKN